MTGYKIDPKGVKGVLQATQAEANEFDTIFKPLDGLVEVAVRAVFDLGLIAPALQTFFAEQTKGLAVVSTRVANGVTGAALATRAYNKADDHMAHEIRAYQRQATALTLADAYGRQQASHHGGGHRQGGR